VITLQGEVVVDDEIALELRCTCESVCEVCLQCDVVVDDEIFLELGGEQMYL
jgi:hypothetical protein